MSHTKRRTLQNHSEAPLRGLPIPAGSWPVDNRKAASVKPIADIELLPGHKKLSRNLLPPDEYTGISAEMRKKREYTAGAP